MQSAKEELKHDKYLGRFFSGIANYYSHKGNPKLAIKYSEDAFEAAKKNQDIELMVPLAVSLCVAYFPAGTYRKIFDLVPDIIALLEKFLILMLDAAPGRTNYPVTWHIVFSFALTVKLLSEAIVADRRC